MQVVLCPVWWNVIFLIVAIGAAFQVTHHSSRSLLLQGSPSIVNGWSELTRSAAKTSSVQEQVILEHEDQPNQLPSPSHRRYSLRHILHPISCPDPHDTNNSSIVGLDAALRFMREALVKLPHSLSSARQDYHDGNFIRLETRIHTIEIIHWLLAQNDFHDTSLYMQTQHRTIAALGIATRYNGTNDGILPEQSVWYGAGRFDQDYPNKDRRWEELENHWILPVLELCRNKDSITLAVHVSKEACDDAMRLLKDVTGRSTSEWKNLPPILSRVASNDVYEFAVEAALEKLSDESFEKVVLARSQTLQFYRKFSSLHALRQLIQEEIHGIVFYIKSGDSEFWGATPEKLFDIFDGKMKTEALAGTRVRGSTFSDDSELLEDLLNSDKDRRENQLTADFIENVLSPFEYNRTFGVRRLRHLQHICQQYTASLPHRSNVLSTARQLCNDLHPTPAVGGLPKKEAMLFLREYEGWDRGLYAGPIGYLGNANDAFLGVGIRSALSATNSETGSTEVQVLGGSGIVQGSTVHGEWSETNSKLAVLASLFPQSPVSLRSAPTPNVAWATAFCEELVRNGVTQFYICPGSRSTPLVVALVQASKKYPFLRVESVHDERSAGFRAVGYARGSYKPAVVVTSSGTAVANLYPAVVEAGMDGQPMVLLTADRPYENRATGANQAIDQVKMFSSSYIRWFRDILPPSDDVPVSMALSDACHAVLTARELRGPVHINVQFRENLAPDGGPIRNDIRHGSVTKFDGLRFTDVPGFGRWSSGGKQWLQSYTPNDLSAQHVGEIARLIEVSRRGIIILGGLRQDNADDSSQASLLAIISDFAQQVGFPIVAGPQCSALRFSSTAVIPFAEPIFRSNLVKRKFDTDLVIQIGWPVVSTAVPAAIRLSANKGNIPYVLVHPHSPGERLDPDLTVSHRVAANPRSFLVAVAEDLRRSDKLKYCFSELSTLACFGRKLRSHMRDIVTRTGDAIRAEQDETCMTEPELIMDLSDSFANGNLQNLFLSNSMPIRDADMFLYPYNNVMSPTNATKSIVACNRGASGIDGIVASALGFAEGSKFPTTLVIGDLATVHDIGSLSSLGARSGQSRGNSVTTIVVNNNGGGIFSFLPVAQHKSEVAFDKYFGTPTDNIAFDDVSRAFGVVSSKSLTRKEFPHFYNNATMLEIDNLIEVKVFERDTNVRAHALINDAIGSYVEDHLVSASTPSTRLGIQLFKSDSDSSHGNTKTMLLLHGWMGSSVDWDPLVSQWTKGMLNNWDIVALDLPGHGRSPKLTSYIDAFLKSPPFAEKLSIDTIAKSVEKELFAAGIRHLDAVVGYSAGGRVALSLKKLSESSESSVVSERTRMILISANPFAEESISGKSAIATELEASLYKDFLTEQSLSDPIDGFVESWYQRPMWGALRRSIGYRLIAERRASALRRRGIDMLEFLRYAGTISSNSTSLTGRTPENTLFIAGALDQKYANIGKGLVSKGIASLEVIEGGGHAMLFEDPEKVAHAVEEFVCRDSDSHIKNHRTKVEPATNVSATSANTSIGIEKTLSMDRIELNANQRNTGISSDSDVRRDVDLSSFGQHFAVDNGLCIHDMEVRSIMYSLIDDSTNGVGWSEAAKSKSPRKSRRGFLLALKTRHHLGSLVGVGEVSPLAGVHEQTLEDLMNEVSSLQQALTLKPLEVDVLKVLRCDGQIANTLNTYIMLAGLPPLSRVLHAGIEMALLSLVSETVGQPLHHCLLSRKTHTTKLPVNGLVTRKPYTDQRKVLQRWFPSYKVKVGHQATEDDQTTMKEVYRYISHHPESSGGRLRADANRAWSESEAIAFASALEGLDIHAIDKIEFIEEPLQLNMQNRSLEAHIEALERSFLHSGIYYALDETIAELAQTCDWEFERVRVTLLKTFSIGNRGCAAFVLKPTVIGFELSLQLARFARTDLGIGAVFSSCFESGLGLAHIALVAYTSDSYECNTDRLTADYPHGIGTFCFLATDTLNPGFGSYVDDEGYLSVSSISRSLFGLRLDELNAIENATPQNTASPLLKNSTHSPFYEASTALGSNQEINVVASVHLPFSVETAFSKFTDFPAMSRWSPWIQNVHYDGNETEWKINVRGIPLRWRATSEIINDPSVPRIQWRSVSGVKNCGVVEFVRNQADNGAESCSMNVDMKIAPPRLLRPIFQNASLFLEDFLREKLLKWSLEMFRDAVKADIALERFVRV